MGGSNHARESGLHRETFENPIHFVVGSRCTTTVVVFVVPFPMVAQPFFINLYSLVQAYLTRLRVCNTTAGLLYRFSRLRLALVIVMCLDLIGIWLRAAAGSPRPGPSRLFPVQASPNPTAVVGRQLSCIQAQHRCFWPYRGNGINHDLYSHIGRLRQNGRACPWFCRYRLAD